MSAFSPDPGGALAGDLSGSSLGPPTPVPAAAEPLPPIRLVSLSSLKAQPPSAGFPRCPDDMALCVTLDSIDRSSAFVVFVSHCWMRGYNGAEGWDGRPHPDNGGHEKCKLTVEGVEKAWQRLAPGMTECYLWIDFSCMNQDADPCGELKQLDKIVQACDCIFTPIVDRDWRQWNAAVETIKNWLEDYRAPLWCDGQYAYVNRAWCRMEMLYAANLDLHADVEQRRSKFAAGLRIAAERNFRPHLLYGHRESQTVRVLPLQLPPLQNSFASTHSPSTGSITKETDRPKIEELMAALTIRCAVEGYKGESNAMGHRHGQGTFRFANGNVYEGQYENDDMHGQGTLRYSDGDVYEGLWENDKKHGQGTYRFASGNVYEGQWKSDQMHGQGTFRYASGDVYEGQWKNDERRGQGTYRYANGDVYEGQWENDNMHGQGKKMSASGAVLQQGRWERGAFVG